MNANAIRALQTQLTALGFDTGGIDGKIGPATRAAIADALAASGRTTGIEWRTWPVGRQEVLCLQILCAEANLNPGDLDGFWGPQTEYASGQLAYLQANGVLPDPWRDRYATPANPNAWPLEREADLNAFYGKPGKNLVMLDLPYPLRLSWDTRTQVTRTQCNTKVAESLGKVLGKVRRDYGLAGIAELRLDLYGGGFNMREKRGGTSLSTHAWGIAFDFDPDRNKLRWDRDRAAFAQPAYDAWWRAWESEGWVSLGRTKNFDWMHVQAARV
jgi:peptidoglycan hydrolase-like protein with peptidoglycan-binding domain